MDIAPHTPEWGLYSIKPPQNIQVYFNCALITRRTNRMAYEKCLKRSKCVDSWEYLFFLKPYHIDTHIITSYKLPSSSLQFLPFFCIHNELFFTQLYCTIYNHKTNKVSNIIYSGDMFPIALLFLQGFSMTIKLSFGRDSH